MGATIPLLVGERINASGSKAVKRLLLAGDYDGIAAVARQQVAAGAQVLDVCVASTEILDEAATMTALVSSLSSQIEVPLMIDSTAPDVLVRALEHLSRPGYVNSLSLAHGRTRMESVLPIARARGAAVVALTIDEAGMAITVERKLAIARRIVDIAVGEHGLSPEALLIDPLTFALGASSPDSARETIDAVRAIKGTLPGVRTILGISDVSFGLPVRARPILNGVFLRHCVAAGLDAAIADPVQVPAWANASEDERRLAEEAIFNRRADALPRFVEAGTR